MAGKVQFSLVALFAGICGLLAAQTARRAPEQTVTVSLPAGEKPLPPGQHRATVHLSGKTVEVQVKVGGSGPASALPAQAPGGPAPPAGAAGETESKAGPPTSASSPVPPAAPETPWMLIGLAAGVPVLLIGLGAARSPLTTPRWNCWPLPSTARRCRCSPKSKASSPAPTAAMRGSSLRLRWR